MKFLSVTVVSLIGLTLGIGGRGQQPAQSRSTMAIREARPVESLSLGKKVFVARCASCHDEDASKRLPDGSSLVARLAGKDDLQAALAGRLRKLPPQEQQAVLLYVKGLVESFRSSHSIPKSPEQ